MLIEPAPAWWLPLCCLEQLSSEYWHSHGLSLPGSLPEEDAAQANGGAPAHSKGRKVTIFCAGV